MIGPTICRCAEALTIHPNSFDGGFDMPGGIIFVMLDAPKHLCIDQFQRRPNDILNVKLWDANPCNKNCFVGVKPSLLIALHHQSIRTMILPVGAGRQEGIPSPNFSLIVALGHSPLSFASRRSSPQHSIFGTQSLHWLATD